MRKLVIWFSGLLLSVFVLAGCNFEFQPAPEVSPTVEAIPTATPEPPTQTPTATEAGIAQEATPEATEEPILASPSDTHTPPPPTDTPTPTENPCPYQHTISSGETLGYIVQQYGHRDFAVIDMVVRLNDNIFDADSVPGEGNVILIPCPTPTPTLNAADPEAVAQAAEDDPIPTVSGDILIGEHMVQSGETILGIAGQYATTLEVLSQLNPDLFFSNCDFTQLTGGPDCNVFLSEGQQINIPAPTPTFTLSPTFSGNETATPTPTFAAPMVISPPQNAVIMPGVVTLQWVSVGVLRRGQQYLVQVTNETTGQQYIEVTSSTSLALPSSMIPADGQTHTINYIVAVAELNADGVYGIVSAQPQVRTFRWQSQ